MKNMNRNKMSWTILGLTVAFWIPYNEYAKSNASKDIAIVNKYLMRAYDNGSDMKHGMHFLVRRTKHGLPWINVHGDMYKLLDIALSDFTIFRTEWK